MADQSKNIQLLNIKTETDYSTHSYPDEYDGISLSLDNTSYVERSNDKSKWKYVLNFTLETKTPLTEKQKSSTKEETYIIEDENGNLTDQTGTKTVNKEYSLQYGIYDGDNSDEICISEGVQGIILNWEDKKETRTDPTTNEEIQKVVGNIAHFSITADNVISKKNIILSSIRLNISDLDYEFGEESVNDTSNPDSSVTKVTSVTCMSADIKSDNSSIKLNIKVVDGQTQTVSMGFKSRDAVTSVGNVYSYPSGYGRLHLEKKPGSVVKLSPSGDKWIVSVGVLITSSGKVNVVRGATCNLTYTVYNGGSTGYTKIKGPTQLSTYFAPWNQEVGGSGSTAYADIPTFEVSGDSTDKISIYIDLDMSKIGYFSLDLQQTVNRLRGNLVVDISNIPLAPIINEFKWRSNEIYEDALSMEFTANRDRISRCKVIITNNDTGDISSIIEFNPTLIDGSTKHEKFLLSKQNNWNKIDYAYHYTVELWIAITRSSYADEKNKYLWSTSSKKQRANTGNHKPKLAGSYISNIDSYKVNWVADIPVIINIGYPLSDIGELYINDTANRSGSITYIKIDPGSIALFRLSVISARKIFNENGIDYGTYISDILSFSIKLLEAAHIEDFKDFIFGNSIPLKLENDTGRDFMIELLANNNLIALRPYDSEERDGYEAITLLQRELDKLYKSFKHTSNEVIILARVKTVGDYGTYYKYTSAKCVVKGNVKTTWIGDDRRVPKRSKDFIGIDDNEIVKRCIAWIGDENEIPRRCI